MRGSPVYSAACPCCASTVVVLARANGHPLAPLTWCCSFCGFSLMGLAVPSEPTRYMDPSRLYTCLQVYEETKVSP